MKSLRVTKEFDDPFIWDNGNLGNFDNYNESLIKLRVFVDVKEQGFLFPIQIKQKWKKGGWCWKDILENEYTERWQAFPQKLLSMIPNQGARIYVSFDCNHYSTTYHSKSKYEKQNRIKSEQNAWL